MSEESGENNNGPNGIIPARIYNGHWKEMSGGEAKIYAVLRRYASTAGMTQMTLKTLSSQAGITRQAQRRILIRLAQRGVLKQYFKAGAATEFLRPGAPKNTWIFYT